MQQWMKLPELKVLTAGYSSHHKFHDNHVAGLKGYLFRLQTNGYCQAKINQQSFSISPGDFLFCRPDDDYELWVDMPGWQEKDALFSTDYFLSGNGAWLDEHWSDRGPTVVKIGLENGILDIWRQLVLEKRHYRDKNPDILHCLTKALLLLLGRLIDSNESQKTSGKAFYPYKMKYFIERHAARHLTLQQVADYVGLSVSRACQLFKSAFNQSIMDYAIEVRLTAARERLLSDGMTLERIAEMSGYDTYTHFYRTFHAKYGMSPREYRNKYRSLKGFHKSETRR
jgi:AraC family transcriptional regulator of arabinose operon